LTYEASKKLAHALGLAKEEDMDTVSLGPHQTGVDDTVFVSTKGYARHASRIKIAFDPPNSPIASGTKVSRVIRDYGVTGEGLTPQLRERAPPKPMPHKASVRGCNFVVQLQATVARATYSWQIFDVLGIACDLRASDFSIGVIDAPMPVLGAFALVVVNAAYKNAVRLPNPRNDATDMSEDMRHRPTRQSGH
jgi:hypothetical protein